MHMVAMCSSFEAEQYGERIIKIGQKLRKLCLFKATNYILEFLSRQIQKRVATRVNGNGPLGNACTLSVGQTEGEVV